MKKLVLVLSTGMIPLYAMDVATHTTMAHAVAKSDYARFYQLMLANEQQDLLQDESRTALYRTACRITSERQQDCACCLTRLRFARAILGTAQLASALFLFCAHFLPNTTALPTRTSDNAGCSIASSLLISMGMYQWYRVFNHGDAYVRAAQARAIEALLRPRVPEPILINRSRIVHHVRFENGDPNEV